jgi:hypothetical protein
MAEMTIELDVRRIELATEGANWRELTATSPDIAQGLAASLEELRTRHTALKADLPAAIASHTAAERACDVAQRRRNTIIGRIARAAPGRLSSALGLLLDSEDQRYRVTQIAMTRAKQTLDQARWDIKCLASDIAQVEAALTPPSPQLAEAVKRPQPTILSPAVNWGDPLAQLPATGAAPFLSAPLSVHAQRCGAAACSPVSHSGSKRAACVFQ